jgi:hypothetical protein
MNGQTDNFVFDLIGDERRPFGGYVSAIDKTDTSPAFLVRGSKNVYRKNNGNIANRDGRLLRGAVDGTAAPVVSSYEWDTSIGIVRPLRVATSKLQVESTVADGVTPVWYDIKTSLSNTRLVADTWWDNVAKRDRLVFCLGDSNTYSWGGGVSIIDTTTPNCITVTGGASSTSFAAGPPTNPLFTGAYFDTNPGSGVNLKAGFVFGSNPSGAGTSFNLTIDGGSSFAIAFVNVLTGVAGQIKIGATAADTTANFLHFLQNPSVTNAQHVAVSGTHQTEIGHYTYAAANALLKKNTTTTWGQDGFSASSYDNSQIVINATTYTYTVGTNTPYLMGITPDPSGEASGSVGLQAVVTHTNSPAASPFTADFLKTVNNQVHVGSYVSKLIYISQDTDFTNFTVPATRVAGDPELIIMDDFGRGLGIRKGAAHIGAGAKYWFVVTFSNITVGSTLAQQTIVDKIPTDNLGAPLAHEFIDTTGNDLVYLSQAQQVRIFGDFKDFLGAPKFPSISQQIKTELPEQDFTGGHLRIVDEFIYLTAPNEGRVYLHQTYETVNDAGQVTTEKVWQPPFDIAVSRIAVINSTTYGHSNSNPQLYQLWDTNQWADDYPSGQLPYDSFMVMAYRHGTSRFVMGNLNMVFYEGYMTESTNLNAALYFEYQAAADSKSLVVNSLSDAATFYGLPSDVSLGQNPLGDDPLGIALSPEDPDDLLPKFRAITDVGMVNCIEYQLLVFSQGAGDRWEILCLGTNFTQTIEQNLGFLRK